MAVFDIILGNLNTLKFYDFLFPWLFTLAITYGILAKAKFFEERSLQGLVSLLVAFFVVNYTPVGIPLSSFFTNLFGAGILILSVIFVVLLFMGLTGISPDKIFANTRTTGIIVILFAALVVIALMGGTVLSADVVTTLFVLVLMAVAIAFVTKGGD